MDDEKASENRFLPDIYEYLEDIENKWSISNEGLDEIIDKIVINSNLSRPESEMIVRLFFQEIRKQLLKGNEIVFRKLGRMYISCPKNSKNKTRVFPKFEPSDFIIEELNYEPDE